MSLVMDVMGECGQDLYGVFRDKSGVLVGHVPELRYQIWKSGRITRRQTRASPQIGSSPSALDPGAAGTCRCQLLQGLIPPADVNSEGPLRGLRTPEPEPHVGSFAIRLSSSKVLSFVFILESSSLLLAIEAYYRYVRNPSTFRKRGANAQSLTEFLHGGGKKGVSEWELHAISPAAPYARSPRESQASGGLPINRGGDEGKPQGRTTDRRAALQIRGDPAKIKGTSRSSNRRETSSLARPRLCSGLFLIPKQASPRGRLDRRDRRLPKVTAYPPQPRRTTPVAPQRQHTRPRPALGT